MANEKKINQTAPYDDDAIITLSPREHLRLRPGMYIGKLGDGSQADDGIYVLIKETVDNSIDEFIMGVGDKIEITIEDDEEMSGSFYITKTKETYVYGDEQDADEKIDAFLSSDGPVLMECLVDPMDLV